jgi:hypothetical protein
VTSDYELPSYLGINGLMNTKHFVPSGNLHFTLLRLEEPQRHAAEISREEIIRHAGEKNTRVFNSFDELYTMFRQIYSVIQKI